jgi:DNA-binding CsgD family transcriptional regulator
LSVLDNWPLIGRAQEMGEVNNLIGAGSYRGVALTGKPCVGKSRLAREAVRAATDAGWTVRRAAATATSRSIPLGAFAQWTDDFQGAPLALARKVIGALTAGTDPERLLIFVDDAHQLDDLSALVVHQLVQAERATAIVTIRTGESAPDAVIALWKDGLLQRRELQPLSRSETDELLTAVLGNAPDRHCGDRLWQLTHGNVLFLRQLVEQETRAARIITRDGAARWLGDLAVSASLADLVDAQIGAIPDTVRDVLDYVAVAEPISWHTLRLLADQIAIEEAEQRELIRTSDDVVYAGHPMYAEVRLNRCGPSRLRRLRGQVAKAMKDSDGPANAVRRALLWLDSDLPPDPDVLLLAATAAGSLLDFESAERLCAAAAEAGADSDARIRLAHNLFVIRKGEFAPDSADSLDAEASSSAFINDVMVRAASLLFPMRSPEKSWCVIEDALLTATGAYRHQLLVVRASQLSLAARPREVLEVTASIDYSQLDALGTIIGLCAESLAFGELGQPDNAVSKAVEGRRVVDLSQEGRFFGHPLAEFHTFSLAAAGRIGEAVEVARAHLHTQQEVPAPAQAVSMEIVGMAMLAAGDLDAALRFLPTHLESDGVNFAVANSYIANSFRRFHMLRAQALARSGAVNAADEALALAHAHHHPAYVYVETVGMLAESWVAAAHQRLTEARRLARSAADFAREHGQWAREVWCLQTAVQFDDTDAAARLAELATFVRGPRVAVAARYASALSADDGVGLDQVSVDFEAMGDLLAAADAAGQAATAHRRAGRSGSAMTAASRVRRLATACGGATSPAIIAAAFAPPFTRREREIAVLVAQGLSNREIAQAVSLSVRTVESHIYNASGKAGVAGRAALGDVIRGATG